MRATLTRCVDADAIEVDRPRTFAKAAETTSDLVDHWDSPTTKVESIALAATDDPANAYGAALTWSDEPTRLEQAAMALADAVRRGQLGRLTVEWSTAPSY